MPPYISHKNYSIIPSISIYLPKTNTMKFIKLLSLAVLLSFVTYAATEKWYAYNNNYCTLLFPEKPEESQQEIDSEIGKLTLDIVMYDASTNEKDKNKIYGLYRTTYPDSLINSNKKELHPTFFRGAIDGAVSNVKGTLISEKDYNMGEFPGKEIKINYEDGLAIINMRCILIHNSLYMLQVIYLTENDNNEACKKFLDSFHLK